jgi:hypothetical protein
MRDVHRFVALFFGIVPGFGPLVYCDLFRSSECPKEIQDLSELTVSCFMVFIWLVLNLRGVGQLHEIFEHSQAEFRPGSMLEDVVFVSRTYTTPSTSVDASFKDGIQVAVSK